MIHRPILHILLTCCLCGFLYLAGAPASAFSEQTVGQQDAATPIADGAPLGVSSERSSRILREARRDLFDYRLDAAIDGFQQLRSEPDGRPAAYHGLLTVELFRGFVTEDPRVFARFDAFADTLESVLDDRDQTPWMRHMEAERRLMMALVEGRRGDYFSAAWKARGARSRFADLEEEHPDFHDPKMGLGLIRIGVATVPRSYRFLLRILGFRGDAEGGQRNLQRAAEGSQTNQYLARAAIAVLDLMLYGKGEEGRRQLDALYADTPNSLFSAFLYAYALISDRRVPEAKPVLDSALQNAATPGYASLDFLDYFYGYALFVENDWEGATTYLGRYLDRHYGDALRAQATLYRGLATEMRAGWDAAQPIYRRVEAHRDFDTDKWAARWARQREVRPMTTAERELLLARNAFDGGRYAEAERRATRLWDAAPDSTRSATEASGMSQEGKTEAAYRLGRTLHATGEYTEALTFYGYAIEHPADDHAKWAPFALLYTGKIHAAARRFGDARNAFERAIDWPTPFDFSDGLEQSATLALERLPDD